MTRTVRAAKGFAASILQLFVQILVQVLLAPVVLKVAGRETLGAYSAVAQVLGFIALTDFLGSWVMERFLGQASALGDGGERFRTIFTTVRTVMLFCASAQALLIFIFSFFVAHLFHLSAHLGHEAQYALWVIAAVVVLRSPFAAYQNASAAMQDIAAVNLIGTVAGIGRTAGSLVFVLMGTGLFGLITAGTIVEGFAYFLYRWRFRKVNPGLMPGWGIPDTALLKEMAHFGANATVLNLGNALLFNSGNMIAGLTNGAAMASSFYTTQVPTMTAWNMTIRFSESAMPAINELWGRGEKVILASALRRITRLLLALTLPLAIGAIIFNRDIVTTWVGQNQYAGSLLTCCLATFCVVVALQRISLVFAFTFGWLRILTVTAILQGIVHFGLAYYLAERIGLGGIILSLVIVLLPQTFILWQRMGRFLEIHVLWLLGSCFLRSVIPLAAAGVAGLLLHRMVHIAQHHFLALAAEMGAFLAAYIVLAYPLVLFREDRHQIRAVLASLFGRVRRIAQIAPAS